MINLKNLAATILNQGGSVANSAIPGGGVQGVKGLGAALSGTALRTHPLPFTFTFRLGQVGICIAIADIHEMTKTAEADSARVSEPGTQSPSAQLTERSHDGNS